MIDFKNVLNEEQYKIVEGGDGYVLVLAGAGSGKTRTVTHRVAYLLENGVNPSEILLLTFTNKAAAEMQERVKKLRNLEIGLPYAGTFHSIFYKILKIYSESAGISKNFVIIDSDDSLDLIKKILKNGYNEEKNKFFPTPRAIQNYISLAKNNLTNLEVVVSKQSEDHLYFLDNLVSIREEYENKKRAQNLLDFDDLLFCFLNLLEKSPEIREKFQNQFKYILVDEYQDVNNLQDRIVGILSEKHKNLLVVGDDAQSIYSFRGAKIENILNFEHKYENVKIFYLETNYRSTPEIVDLASSIIRNNKKQFEKNLKSANNNFVKPEVYPFVNVKDEADFIVKRIKELEEENLPLNKIAVLFRASSHSEALEIELIKNNINYEYRGGMRFFERAHIKDTLVFLRLVVNQYDKIAFDRALGLFDGLGQKTIDNLYLQMLDEKPKKITEIEFKLGAKAKIGFNEFLSIFKRLIEKTDQSPPSLIETIIESSYSDYLKAEYDNYRERINDLEELVLYSDEKQTLEEFLSALALDSLKDRERKNGEALILSTVHQAKGLEWDTVFVIHLADGMFPSERSLKKEEDIEEERRLFYVASTRAEKRLYLTYPLTGRFQKFMMEESPFLLELDKDKINYFNFGDFGEEQNDENFNF
jgi:DNA helicase-2/ATP-dependent DNA helicase PcrA